MTRHNKKRKQKRAMPRRRLEAVRRIEKTHRSGKTGSSDPDQLQSRPADPALLKQIQELRLLGISVSDSATAQKIQSLRAEFDLVDRYVRDVMQTLMPNTSHLDPLEQLPPDTMRRFVAMLFGNGQLVYGIAAAQRDRELLTAKLPLDKTQPFKQVTKLLRREFADLLPKRAWWSRLWRRPLDQPRPKQPLG